MRGLVAVTMLGAVLGSHPVQAGHNSLLALRNDGGALLTANTDNGSVTLIDTSGDPRSFKVVREIRIGIRPESAAWIGDGPLAMTADYDRDEVVVFNTESGAIVRRIATADEPYGLVVDNAGKFAYVTHDYPGLVSEIDLTSYEVTREMAVGSYVRGIAMLPDESRLLVTHYYTGWLSAVDRKTGAVVDHWSGSSSDNLARQVCVHPTLPFAYVPHIRSRTERAHGAGSIFPYVSVFDLVPSDTQERRRHTIAMDTYNGVVVTCNPWETAVSPDGKRHYTVYAGTNDINVSDVLDDGYRYLRPVGRLVRVGNNPRAVTVSPDGDLVYIYNFLDFSVGVYQAEPFRKLEEIEVCARPYAEPIHRGKVLFNTAVHPMTRQRWIACSSCHPEADHDGRVWQNPEGLRRTTHFFGMKRTHPIHWSADRDEVQDFEHTIRGPLMQGRGLIDGPVADSLGDPNKGRSKDLDALADYCNKFDHTLSPHAAGPGKLTPAAERGRKLFFSEQTKCATCHSGPDYTDSSLDKPFKLHDVGTGTQDPTEKMGPKFDTPTLLRVYRQTSYLHHGKAKTLEEVFTKYNPKDQHGTTSQLSKVEINDLVAFLRSLPY